MSRPKIRTTKPDDKCDSILTMGRCTGFFYCHCKQFFAGRQSPIFDSGLVFKLKNYTNCLFYEKADYNVCIFHKILLK